MTIRDRRAIRAAADSALGSAQQGMRQILLSYIGIITALSLGCSVLTVILSDRIADTGGLRNMGLRSALSTAQTLLPIVQMLVLWGLQLGYHTAALRVARGEPVSSDTLFGGFRRFFPLLRAMLVQGFLYTMAGVMSMYAAVYIFLLLPVSGDFQEIVMPAIESASILSGTITLDEATVMAAAGAMMPALWIFGGLFLLFFVPMYYRYRLVMYRLIDHSHPRAFLALLESRAIMRRSRFQLLKLDLGFWWFYALQLLAPLLCYGDVLLGMFGIALPVPEMAAYFLFLILSLAAQAVIFSLALNRVSVTYAVFYDTLLAQKEAERAERQRPPLPVHIPWQSPYEDENP